MFFLSLTILGPTCCVYMQSHQSPPPTSLHIPYWQEFPSLTHPTVQSVCPKFIVAHYGQKGLSGFVSCTLLLWPNRRLECGREMTALRSVPAQRMGLRMLRWYLTLGDVKDPSKDPYNTVSGEGTHTNWWACETVIHFKAEFDLFEVFSTCSIWHSEHILLHILIFAFLAPHLSLHSFLKNFYYTHIHFLKCLCKL